MSDPWDPANPGGAGEPPQQPPAEGWPPAGGVPPQSYPPGGEPQQQPYQQQPPQQPYQQQPYQQQPYQQPGYPGAGGHVGGKPSHDANTALAVSVTGLLVTLVLGFCCGPFGVFGVALSGVGAYLATKELRAIDAGLSNPAGRSQARAAQVIGWVGVGLFVIGLMLFVAFLGLSVVTSA